MRRFLALFLLCVLPALAAEKEDRARRLASELSVMARFGPDRLGYVEFAAAYLRDKYNVEFGELPHQNRAPSESDFDAFSILSGNLAVRESLQLDRLRTFDPAEDTVELSSLEGPSAPSHPFKEMLGGRSVGLPELAKLVPHDFYFFHSANPGDAASLFGSLAASLGPAVNRFLPAHVDFQTEQKFIEQLALRIDPSNQKYYAFIFHEIAVTGSDPFFGSGTDVTLIFRLKRKDTFLAQVAEYRQYYKQQGAVLSQVDVGLPAELLSTPDRRVHSYLLNLPGDIVVISNSAAALRRIVRVQRGELPSMAVQDEYRFMRTVYPYGPSEAAFLYLSDPFIRRITGPEVRIKEARRVYESMRLAALERYAILYYQLNGRRASSLADLKNEFGGEAMLKFSDLQIDAGSFAARGRYGRIGHMVPNIDTELTRVSEQESQGYAAFLEQYNSYWRRYFDPVGMRFSQSGRIKIETCILPLIENSIYNGVKEIAAGDPVPLRGADTALENEVLSGSARINTDKLGEMLNKASSDYLETNKINLADIFEPEVQIHALDSLPLVDFDAGILLRESLRGRAASDKALVGFLFWSAFHPVRASIPLKTPAAADRALALVDALTSAAAARQSRGLRVDPYEKIVDGKRFRVCVLSVENVIKIRLYFAVHNGALHMTTTEQHIRDILAGGLEKSLPQRFMDFFRRPPEPPPGHVALALRPAAMNLERPLALANAGETARDAAFENFSTYLLFRSLFGENTDRSIESFGFRLDPSTRLRMENGVPAADSFGTAAKPVIDQDRNADWQRHLDTKQIRINLEFTKEGLKSVVEIEP